MYLSLTQQVFHSTPPTGGVESIRGNSVCLYVRHHFNISNLGPSNHPRIMLGLTYYTSLDRGWHQRWQWQWQRRTQRQRQRQKYWKDPTCAIFLKRIWLKDIKYDDGGWISDDALGVMHRGWCTGDDAPGDSINGSDMPSALGLVLILFGSSFALYFIA